MCAQVIHAAGESSSGELQPGTYAVALAARDEAQLKEIAQSLRARGTSFVEVVENEGHYRGQLMALGLRPGLRSEVRRGVSNLPLISAKNTGLNSPPAVRPYRPGWGGLWEHLKEVVV